MPCWPVSHRDGKFQVTDSDGILYPITMGRSPVESLQPGWVPVGLQTGLKPFHLLELRNEGGPIHEAVWYLTEDLDYVNNAPRHFSPEQSALFVSSLSPLLRDIYDQSLCAAQPGVADSSHDFDGINPLFVRELIGHVVTTALTPPDVVAARRLDSISSHYMAAGVRLSASLLRHSLDITAPTQVEPGMTLASPFDASLLTAQEQFVPADSVLAQAYRFHDQAGRLAFYLLFTQLGAPALYIPVANTVFAAEDGLSGAQVMTALFSHYASNTDRAVHTAKPFDAAPAEPFDAPPAEPFDAAPAEPAGFMAKPGGGSPAEPVGSSLAEPVGSSLAEPVGASPLESFDRSLAGSHEPVGTMRDEPFHPEAAEPAPAETHDAAASAEGAGAGSGDPDRTDPAAADGGPEAVGQAHPGPANWWKRLFGLGQP